MKLFKLFAYLLIAAIAGTICFSSLQLLMSGTLPAGAVGTALLAIIAALAAAIGIGFWLPGKWRQWALPALIAVLGGLYLFEGWLWANPTRTDANETAVSDIVYSLRGRSDLAIQQTPSSHLAVDWPVNMPDGRRYYPLGGVSNATTVMCNEGNQPVVVFRSDKYGFNNPATAWNGVGGIALVGDSFVFGNCVDDDKHFAGQIRQIESKTVNLGYGGNGPLLTLASLREYLPLVSPKIVFWFYDENNDLYLAKPEGGWHYVFSISDFAKELRNKTLRRYLDDPGFQQGLAAAAADIGVIIKLRSDKWLARRIAEHRPWNRWLKFLTIPKTRRTLSIQGFAGLSPVGIGSAWAGTVGGDTGNFIRQYRDVLAAAAASVRSWGGELVFVNLPSTFSICRSWDAPEKRELLGAVRGLGLRIVDLEGPLRRAATAVNRAALREDQRLFAEPWCDGHFSEVGYRVVGDALIEFLDKAK